MPVTTLRRSRSDLETELARAFVRYEKEFMGRGPLETKAYLLDDMVLVRLKGVLTPAERKLAESQRDRSAYLMKQVRNELLTSGRAQVEAIIQDILEERVQSIHTDISTKTGERIIVVTLQPRDTAQRGRSSGALPGERESASRERAKEACGAEIGAED